MKNIFKILIVFVSFFTTKQNIYAQAGTLDPTFGDDGIIIVNANRGANYSIIQPDGKIILMSSYFGVNLDRLNADGTYDESFGINGHANFNFNGKMYGSLNNTMALLNDGKIVCAARYFPGGNTNVGILRINANGTLDSSFGRNGLDSLNIDKINTATGIVVQPDGKIVVSGDVQKNEYNEQRTFLCRYMPDGGLDPTFGETGIVVSQYVNATTSNSLIIRTDGKIIRGSNYNLYGDHPAYMLEGFNTDGSKDESFGDNGVAKYYFGSGQSGVWNNGMYSMVLQPDGKIVCTGVSGQDEDIFMAVCRFNNDGSVDESFGDNGGTITPYKNFNSIYSLSIDVQSDGKIITCGNALGISDNDSPLLLCRYSENGQLDPNFGENGISSTLTDTISLGAQTVHFLSTGKILVTGDAGKNILLARFNNDPVLAANFKEVKAAQNQDAITITWQTLNESGTKSFTVERSSNANDYAGINTVPAKGVASNYSYTDKNPLSGTSYYRIRENAANGINTFSPVVKVVFNDNGVISLYPNPAKNTVTVKGLNKNITATIRITDMNGREISKQNFTQSSSATLNIRALAQGSYFVLVEENGKVTKLRIVKE